MGGQSIERREILRYIGIAAVAGSFPGFHRWAFACPMDHPRIAKPQARPQGYKPLFFSTQQFQMVERLTEMIIPEDDTPGAKQAGVAEFIDFMVANRVPVSASRDIRSTDDAIAAGNEAQNRFVAGLDWINARSESLFQREFMQCTPEGKVIRRLGTRAQAGCDDRHFNRPADVAVSPRGDVFVADGYGNARVVRFDKDGNFVKA